MTPTPIPAIEWLEILAWLAAYAFLLFCWLVLAKGAARRDAAALGLDAERLGSTQRGKAPRRAAASVGDRGRQRLLEGQGPGSDDVVGGFRQLDDPGPF